MRGEGDDPALRLPAARETVAPEKGACPYHTNKDSASRQSRR
jgi:hypothetical protein